MKPDPELIERMVTRVISAHSAKMRADARYRELLREAATVRGVQAEVSRRLNRSRELLRQDAMTEEELAQHRAHDAARKRRPTATQGE